MDDKSKKVEPEEKSKKVLEEKKSTKPEEKKKPVEDKKELMKDMGMIEDFNFSASKNDYNVSLQQE